MPKKHNAGQQLVRLGDTEREVLFVQVGVSQVPFDEVVYTLTAM